MHEAALSGPVAFSWLFYYEKGVKWLTLTNQMK